MMISYTTTSRGASRTDPPDNWISIGDAAEDVLGQVAARRARFAREAVNAAFGHHGRALDQGSFVDHPPIRPKLPAVADITRAPRARP